MYQNTRFLFYKNKEEIDKVKALNNKLYVEYKKNKDKKEVEEDEHTSSYKIDLTIKPHWLKILTYYHSMLHDEDEQKIIYDESIEQIKKDGRLAAKTNQYSQNINCPEFSYFNLSFDGIKNRMKIWNATLGQFSEDTAQNFIFERREGAIEWRGDRDEMDELQIKIDKLTDKSDISNLIKNSGVCVPVPVTASIKVHEDSIIVEEMPVLFMPTWHVIREIIRHHELNTPQGMFVLSFSKGLEKTLSKCGVKYSANPFDSVSKAKNSNYQEKDYYGNPEDISKFDLTREECRLKLSEGEFKEYRIESYIKEEDRDEWNDAILWDKYNEHRYKNALKTLKGTKLIDIDDEGSPFSGSISKHILTHKFMTVEFSIRFEDRYGRLGSAYDTDYEDNSYHVFDLLGIKDPQSLIDAYKKDQQERTSKRNKDLKEVIDTQMEEYEKSIIDLGYSAADFKCKINEKTIDGYELPVLMGKITITRLSTHKSKKYNAKRKSEYRRYFSEWPSRFAKDLKKGYYDLT